MPCAVAQVRTYSGAHAIFALMYNSLSDSDRNRITELVEMLEDADDQATVEQDLRLGHDLTPFEAYKLLFSQEENIYEP